MVQILDKYGNTSTDDARVLVLDKNGNIKRVSGGGGGSPTGPAGGDLSGTYPNPTVVWNNGTSTYNLLYYAIPTGTVSEYIDGTGAFQTFPTIPTVGTWGALNYPTWTTGTPFVKMTAAGTFALDTNTYLTTISGITAGGDLNGTYSNPTVDGLQGNAVSNVTPVNGQVLQWTGSAWTPGAIPTGGSGGGGVFYYFNYQNTTGISPTTGLPTSPVAPSQLGITYSVGAGSITSANLTNGSYILVCGFVTIVGTPGVTNIPAGLWDFNIWAQVTGATGSANQTQFQIRVYKYDSIGGTYTSLANSDAVYIYDPTVIAQYIANVTMPQTTLLVTDRIYIEFWAQKNVAQPRQIDFYFDSGHPSHVHTTIPSVSGTGIVKVINGVFQSPASLLVDADVSATAAIAVSKLAMSTNRLLGRTTAGSGAVEEISLTTTGYSGTATLTGGNLNIPQYMSASTRRNANNSTNNNINYCGVALGTGVSESSAVWTITRLTIAASGSITIATATNVAWTNRESAIYI